MLTTRGQRRRKDKNSTIVISTKLSDKLKAWHNFWKKLFCTPAWWGVCFSVNLLKHFLPRANKHSHACVTLHDDLTDLTKYFHSINVKVKCFAIFILYLFSCFQLCSVVSSMQGTEAYLGRLCQLEWWLGDLCGPGRCHYLPRTFWPLHGHCPPHYLPVSLFLSPLSTKNTSFCLE